jgi:hypothetical protein
MIAQYGSYYVTCVKCQSGPATSFVSVMRHLSGTYRAVIVDDNLDEVEFVAEGAGSAFFDAVRKVASTGRKVQLDPLTD